MTDLTVIEIALPVLHPKQALMNAKSLRFNLYRCGRRFGKDVLMERRACRRIDTSQFQAWFAPTYDEMKYNFQSIRDRLYPILKSANKSDWEIVLTNDSSIKFFSMDNDSYESARGKKFHHVTINEAAKVKNLKDAWFSVIRPTLADFGGGADFGSTPRGLNFFYELERDNKTSPDWYMAHFTTYDNPYIPKDEIESMQAAMPDLTFKQEIMAEYVESGAYFVNIDEVCVVDAPESPDDHKNHRFCAGLDWGLSEDFTRLTILCATCGKSVDWWGGGKMDYDMQIQFMEPIIKRWPDCQVLPERNSMGVPNIENMNRRGIMVGMGPDQGFGYYTTRLTKAPLIMKLALLMQKKEIKLPREYADELRAFEVEVTTTNPKFGAPSGQHDDCVISAALAVWLAESPIQIFI